MQEQGKFLQSALCIIYYMLDYVFFVENLKIFMNPQCISVIALDVEKRGVNKIKEVYVVIQ